MAATVKTLLQHHGELHWGSQLGYLGYQFGLSLDVDEGGITAQIVYVKSKHDDKGNEFVTPELLTTCSTPQDLERNGIILNGCTSAEEEQPVRGWYCIERSYFPKDQVDALLTSNERLGGYLDTILRVMLITPQEVENGLPNIDKLYFYDLLEELEDLSHHLDQGDLQKPLPFEFHLIGDALLGWKTADEADFR